MAGPLKQPPQRRMPPGVTADQLAIARGNFQRAFDAGQAQVFDRFRHPVEPGQFVLFHVDKDLIWEVTEVKPDPNPASPPGVLMVKIECEIPVMYAVGQIAQDMIIVGQKNARGDAEITGPRGMPSDNGATSPAEGHVEGPPASLIVLPPGAKGDGDAE